MHIYLCSVYLFYELDTTAISNILRILFLTKIPTPPDPLQALLEIVFLLFPTQYRGCPYLGGLKYTIYIEIAVGATACVRYLEVVRFSEGPLINRGFTVYIVHDI